MSQWPKARNKKINKIYIIEVMVTVWIKSVLGVLFSPIIKRDSNAIVEFDPNHQ